MKKFQVSVNVLNKWYTEEMFKIYTNKKLLKGCSAVTFYLLVFLYISPVIDLRPHAKL